MTDTTVDRVDLGRRVEATPMQRSLLASQARFPAAPLQNMALLTRIEGTVEPEELARAFAAVVRAADALRTVADDVSGTLRVVHGAGRSEIVEMGEADAVEWAQARARRPIDLRVRGHDSAILCHPDGTASWYLALHHAITDATSSQLVYDATAAAFAGQTPELPSYYGWWADAAADRRLAAARAHWGDRPPAPRVGRLYEAVRRPDPASSRVSVPLGDGLGRRLSARLADSLAMVSDDLAWTTTLLTTSAVLVHRLTGAERFAIGVPVHNRRSAASRAVIGPLMEVLPVDVVVEPTDTLRSLHGRTGRALMGAIRHARPGAAPPGTDIESVVNVIPRAGLGAFGALPATTRWIHPGASDPSHLFRLQLTHYGDELDLVLDLSHQAAGPAHIARAPAHVSRILESLTGDLDRPIHDAPLCAADERTTIERWESGPQPIGQPTMVTTALAEALALRDDIAVGGATEMTGRAVWDRSVAVARWLRSIGVGSEGPGRVGIEMPRSADALCAIFGTLLAGGSFVPLDPNQPEARRRRLAERAGCAVVLRDLAEVDAIAPEQGPGSPDDVADPPVPIDPDDEAYLLFTSGSSGEPKGVPIGHRGLARYLQFAVDAYTGDEPPVAPLFTELTFDLTITSLFVPLLAGGRLVVVPEDGPAALSAVARRDDLTWCKATPSHLELLQRLDPAFRLRWLVVGGEAFPARLARDVFESMPGVRIFNEYGPTEAVVGCMIHETSPDEVAALVDVPIGRPAPGVRLRLVDSGDQPVPIGGVGELLISHDGLTRGYLGGDTDPFVELDGRRWYRSGDLARMLDDETLVYHGRVDEQIKVGGIRLDPTEVEAALEAHPAVERAVVRSWRPPTRPPGRHCVRCGLPDNVPGASFDEVGVCATCRQHDSVRDTAAAYFGTRDDLIAIRDDARRERRGQYDCLHLLSGGKDSTYALYQLVELGFDVLAVTLDNGFISEGAKENVRRSVADLGVDHEFMTTDAMDEIFRDSLRRFSNVCNGCYKTIYTLATARADELGIPVIVTGLSRGQLFETRLIPAQFEAERFDVDAIDRAVVAARRAYHRVDDAAGRLLDTTVFDDDRVFERISYVDFYRYADVELAEMLEFLERRAPWVRPADTGRSTNCLVNAAGIHTHVTEQGFHNYAIPYAWDVRLGHKTRDEAIEELDDDLDLTAVESMLERIGYEPHAREVLTAWYQLRSEAAAPPPAELRAFLAERLPSHAIPAAYVVVDAVPVTSNGKVDTGSLPAPGRTSRSTLHVSVDSESELERSVVAVIEAVLRLEPVGVTDDFFDLGGDSLAALEVAVELGELLGRTVRDEIVFDHPTPRAIATALEREESDQGGGPSTRPADEPPPLSSAERAMLFEHLSAPADPRYNVGHLYRIRGHVDVPALTEAVRRAASRHVPLTWSYDEPRRPLSIDDAIEVVVRSDPVADDRVVDSIRRFHLRPFDLEHGPIARCVVQPVDDGSTALALVVHHIAIDAGSIDRLWMQIDDEYCGRPVTLPPYDSADHATWQEERASGIDLSRWLGGEEPARVELGGSTAGGTNASGYVQRRATFDTRSLRTGPGATPFATALGALAAVLRRRADGDRIGLGLTISNREHRDAEPLVGLFLTTVPIELEASPRSTGAELAAAAGTAVADAMRVRAVSFADIVAARRRNGLPAPATSILVAYEDWRECRLGSTPVDHEVLATGSPVRSATFFVQVHGDRVELSVEFASDVMDAEAAVRLLDEWDETVVRMIERPLAAAGSDEPPSRARGPELAAPARALHELIVEQAHRHPELAAVVQGDTTLSYGDLVARAEALAGRLIAQGVEPRAMLGVAADRRPESIVAALGVLLAGAVYVPLDPAYPAPRLRHVVDDAGIDRLIAAPGTAFPPLDDRAIERCDVPEAGSDDPVALPTVSPDDAAYVIYTSGSTGAPKGVVVRHRNIVASTAARETVYGEPVQRFLHLSSLSFDSSMVGLWWTLCTGGTIVLPERGRHDDILHLLELAAARRITHLLALPSLYAALLAEAGDHHLASLRQAIVAGESCASDVVRAHRERCPDARLTNEYGPTEATVWTHAEHLDHWDGGAVPIGTPIPGVLADVVADDGSVVPIGRIGELLVGGAGVAAGYLGDAERTAQRFVERSDADGVSSRWYRTGDLVRSDHDGRLEFVGRADDQMKISGHRIEPAEVERALRALPDVRDAVVGSASLGARTVLAAWIVREPTGDASDVRDRLAAHLPTHLVPTVYVELEALPLGPNGKIDRSVLPPPVVTSSGDAVAPGSTHESTLAAIWADVLALESVAPTDDFFELGGDSILSLQIVARARRAGIELRPRDVFDRPTVRELAAFARSAGATVDRGPTVGNVPLTPIGHWFFEQPLDARDHWNQSLRLDLAPGVDAGLLGAAFERVRAHHDALRSRFEPVGGEWRHTITAEAPPTAVRVVPDSELAAAEREAAASLDIGAGRIAALVIGRAASGEPTSVFTTIHHLVVDAVSWTPILEDWTSAYVSLAAGREPELPARAASVLDWSLALERFATEHVGELASGWRLPERARVDRAVPCTVGDAGRAVRHLSVERTERLLAGSAHASDGPTIDELLLAACALAIPDVTELPAIVLLEGHGRESVVDGQLDVSRTVGWFTSQCPVDLQLPDRSDAAACRDEVVRRLRAIPDRGVGFGIARHLVGGSEAAGGQLPEIAVNFLGRLDRTFRVSHPFRRAGVLHGDVGPTNPRSHLLGVIASVTADGFRLEIDHDPAHLTSTDADRLAERVLSALESVSAEPRERRFELVDLDDGALGRLASLLDEVDER